VTPCPAGTPAEIAPATVARCIGTLYKCRVNLSQPPNGLSEPARDLSQPATDLLELVSLVIRGVSGNRDLSLTAAAALSSLDRYGAQRITTMAAAEGVSQPSMSQLMQRLEQRGLVARMSDPSDGRVALVSLTDEGRAALAARRARNARRIAALLADLPDDEVRSLASALAAVLPAIRQRVGGDAKVLSGLAGS
jgi:DNA-binding MarR family transcriptional regulator